MLLLAFHFQFNLSQIIAWYWHHRSNRSFRAFGECSLSLSFSLSGSLVHCKPIRLKRGKMFMNYTYWTSIKTSFQHLGIIGKCIRCVVIVGFYFWPFRFRLRQIERCTFPFTCFTRTHIRSHNGNVHNFSSKQQQQQQQTAAAKNNNFSFLFLAYSKPNLDNNRSRYSMRFEYMYDAYILVYYNLYINHSGYWKLNYGMNAYSFVCLWNCAAKQCSFYFVFSFK